MHLKTLVALATAMAALSAATAQNKPQPVCESSCGDLDIIYPFGSGDGCYYNPAFLVTCDNSTGKPVLFFGAIEGNIVITNTSTSTSEVEIMMSVGHDCYDSFGNVTRYNNLSLDSGFFRVSPTNKFVAIGCDTFAYFQGTRWNARVDGTGCISRCDRNSNLVNGSCSGVGCCEVAIPDGLRSFNISVGSFNSHENITDFNPCGHGFFVEQGKFNFSTTNLLDFQNVSEMPMLLDWAFGNLTCGQVDKTDDNFLCKGKSECDEDYKGPGYRCRCKPGYEGNPYDLQDGCKNINECEQGTHDCEHECEDTDGDYRCTCREGYSGDGRKNGTRCIPDESAVIKIVIGVSMSMGVPLLLQSATYCAK